MHQETKFEMKEFKC